MEEETYTRWLFPGAFAVGTFLWLGYNLDVCVLDEIFSSDARIEVLVVFLTGVPVIGFLASSLARLITNDYTGWCCWRSKVRKLCKERFKKDVPSQLLKPLEICSVDPDVLFSLAALGVVKDHSMPEFLIKHGRRRWTTWWTALNSIMGIVFGVLIFYIYHRSFSWWNKAMVLPLIVSLLLCIVGFWAWRKEDDLELGWFVLTYGASGERLSNLIQKQLKGDVKMDRVKIKYNDLIELLKNTLGDELLTEALKFGKIDIVDDVTGEKIGVIPLKEDSNKNL